MTAGELLLNTGRITVGAGGTISIGNPFSSIPGGITLGNTTVLEAVNGGTLETGNFIGGFNTGSVGTLALSGGTLKVAIQALTASVPVVLTNSSTVDTNALSATFSSVLSGTGSLTKTGAGTLTLSAANTYTGATTIAAGTLRLDATSSLANSAGFTVDAGATFDVSALSGGLTLGSNQFLAGSGNVVGQVALGAGARLQASPGTSFNSGLTLAAGSVFDFRLGTTSDLIRVTGGTLTGPTTGLITFNLSNSGGFTAGTYPLLNYASASGTASFDATDFALGTSIAGYTYQFTLANNALNLIATASAIPEPSTYAALTGLVMLAVVALRKKRGTSP